MLPGRGGEMPGILAGVPMAASKRPSTSSLRRFITSRPYVTVAELRRRFGLDDPDAMSCLAHEGRQVYVGLPEREALKIDDLLGRGEIGVELSVEVRAPVAVGVYPMRIARYVVDGPMNGNGDGTMPVDVGRAEGTLADASIEPPQPSPAVSASGGALAIEAARPSDRLPQGPARDEVQESAESPGGDGQGSVRREARDPRATRHNGRPVPRRQRGNRHHRPHAGQGGAPGHTSAGPQ